MPHAVAVGLVDGTSPSLRAIRTCQGDLGKVGTVEAACHPQDWLHGAQGPAKHAWEVLFLDRILPLTSPQYSIFSGQNSVRTYLPTDLHIARNLM